MFPNSCNLETRTLWCKNVCVRDPSEPNCVPSGTWNTTRIKRGAKEMGWKIRGGIERISERAGGEGGGMGGGMPWPLSVALFRKSGI